MSYLLDTNIISELRKPLQRQNAGVATWFAQVNADELYLSVLVMGELRKGIENIRRRDPVAAQHLSLWLQRLVQHYAARILPVDHAIAAQWGNLYAIRRFPVIDGLLAATAIVQDKILVTRNVADVADSGAQIFNPFE